ncbi:MAG: hypothetical protein ACLQSR_12075, partial [Limisphaerales bacterium]
LIRHLRRSIRSSVLNVLKFSTFRFLARILHIALETTTDRSADMLLAWDFRMPKAGCKPALRRCGCEISGAND